jgi:hypothetical protein
VPAAVRTAGGYVSRPNTAATRFTGPFTMMVWMKPTTLVAGQNHVDMSGVIFNADYLTPRAGTDTRCTATSTGRSASRSGCDRLRHPGQHRDRAR